MFGRKRHIPELRAGNANQRGFGERTAMNHPMQGSAADIIKLAMGEVQRRLMAEGFARSCFCRCTTSWTSACPRPRSSALGAGEGGHGGRGCSLRVPLVADVSCRRTRWARVALGRLSPTGGFFAMDAAGASRAKRFGDPEKNHATPPRWRRFAIMTNVALERACVGRVR